MLGVIYGSLVWMVCNPAAPAGPRGIPGLSPGPLAAKQLSRAASKLKVLVNWFIAALLIR